MVRAAANGVARGTPPLPGTPFLIDQSDTEPPRHGLQDLDCSRTVRPPGRAARPRIDRGDQDVPGGGAAREPPLSATLPADPRVLVAAGVPRRGARADRLLPGPGSIRRHADRAAGRHRGAAPLARVPRADLAAARSGRAQLPRRGNGYRVVPLRAYPARAARRERAAPAPPVAALHGAAPRRAALRAAARSARPLGRSTQPSCGWLPAARPPGQRSRRPPGSACPSALRWPAPGGRPARCWARRRTARAPRTTDFAAIPPPWRISRT